MSFKEQDTHKVQQYLKVLACFSDTPIVYIDETGIDTYLYRKHGRSKRGQKIFDKKSGRRFERTSLVAGQVGNQLIAPMMYKESMTSDFFVAWFEQQLIPSLTEPHLVIMDNASFHPKARLDNICIQHHHYFLPLPPYSPELNPIEQTWAVLKHHITELLRKLSSIPECFEYYFKT